MEQKLNYKGRDFWYSSSITPKKILNFKCRFFDDIYTFGCSKKFRETNSKIRLQEIFEMRLWIVVQDLKKVLQKL